MFFQQLAHVLNMFFQWWLTSDQILFRRFLVHEKMIHSLAISLGVNLWGLFTLYIPIKFLIPEDALEKLRSYLKRKSSLIRRHLERVENFTETYEDGRFGLLKSKERRDEAISELIDTYEYDYMFVFGLSVLPIPFLGTIMTGGAIFAVEALEIRFGILVIIIAKVVKVFALATIAYFAYFL